VRLAATASPDDCDSDELVSPGKRPVGYPETGMTEAIQTDFALAPIYRNNLLNKDLQPTSTFFPCIVHLFVR
jgi:hypothetical protein